MMSNDPKKRFSRFWIFFDLPMSFYHQKTMFFGHVEMNIFGSVISALCRCDVYNNYCLFFAVIWGRNSKKMYKIMKKRLKTILQLKYIVLSQISMNKWVWGDQIRKIAKNVHFVPLVFYHRYIYIYIYIYMTDSINPLPP